MKEYPKVIYLAGAIESVSDIGLNWRKEYQRDISSIGNYVVIIPGESENKEILKGYKDLAEKDPLEFKKKFHKEIVEVDIEAMMSSNFVVVKYEGEKTCGTIDEVCTAFREGIPVIMVTKLPIREINSWLLAHTSELVRNKGELLELLRKIG